MATVTLAPATTAGATSLSARLSRLAALRLVGSMAGATSVVADIAGDTHFRLDPIVGSTSVAISEPVSEWQPFPLTPSGIGFESAVAAHGSLLVIAGGYLDSGGRTAHCYVYDTATGGPWTAIADLPVAMGDGTLISVGSRIYFLGGDAGSKVATSYFYDFDNAGTGWQAGPALPMAMYAPPACVADGLAYIGLWGVYAGDTVNTLRFFSIDLLAAVPTFTRLADGPTYRQWTLTVRHDGAIYVVSGDNNDYDSATDSVPVLRYDIAANAWASVSIPATPGYSWIAGGGISGDTIYLLQASTGSDANRFLSYTFGSGQSSWTTLPNGPFTEDTATDINSAIVDGAVYAATNDYRGDTPPDALYHFDLPRPRTPALQPTSLRGATIETAVLSRWRNLIPELLDGRGWGTARLDRAGVLTPTPIVGTGGMRVAGGQELPTDRIIGATQLAAPLLVTGPVLLVAAGITGATEFAVTVVPDFDTAEPVLLDWAAAATLVVDDNRPPIPNTTPGVTRNRAMPGVVITTPPPAIADGQPTLPEHWARFEATATLRQGAGHIRALADPDPKWDPRFDGWSVPPSSPVGVGDYRWTVAALPDPAGFPGGWYWLGEPSARDSTSGITAAARQWAADPSTGGPAWRSFFPFKPSVSAVSAAVPGERDPVHYSRVLHLSTHYVEHMWLDFGKNMPQPFTWLVVAMVTSDPATGYLHTILDAGRDPDTVGFPRIAADDTATDRRIADNLPYRMQLAATRSTIQMATSAAKLSVGLGSGAGYRPRMYTGVFNGTKSLLSAWDKAGRHAAAGAIGTGSSYTHRYAVLGRQQGWISQDRAANLMVFEIRYWAHALTVDELEGQFAQISSTYKFSQYG